VKQQYLQDFEVRRIYLRDIYVLFLDYQSLQRISESGDTFYIISPIIIEKRPGGLGLDDIRHLLDSADIEKSYEFASTEPNPTEKVIGATITRRMLFIVHLTFFFTINQKYHRFHRFLHKTKTLPDSSALATKNSFLIMGWLPQTGT